MSRQEHSTSEVDAEVRKAVYDRFLVHAAPISKQQVAEKLSLSVEQVATSYQRLAEAHMLVLQPASGEVLMANPFSAVPTAFRVRSADKQWWANCIWDGLGVLAMLHQDGSVETSCPDCGEALQLAVESGELSQGQGVVHFAVPASRWWDDIVFT
jgi:hypothetical protein